MNTLILALEDRIHSYEFLSEERIPKLKHLVKSLTQGMGFKFTEPSDWFTTAQENGRFIWDVPPAAGDVVYELIDKASLKHPNAQPKG